MRPDERVGHDDLMRYLDGELAPERRAEVEAGLGRSTELQRELAIFRSLQAGFRDLSFAPLPPDRSVWDRVSRRVVRPTGWILVLAGTAVWSGYGVYLWATSAVQLWEKLTTAAVVIGLILLLASVIWEQYRQWLIDPYKDVNR